MLSDISVPRSFGKENKAAWNNQYRWVWCKHLVLHCIQSVSNWNAWYTIWSEWHQFRQRHNWSQWQSKFWWNEKWSESLFYEYQRNKEDNHFVLAKIHKKVSSCIEGCNRWKTSRRVTQDNTYLAAKILSLLSVLIWHSVLTLFWIVSNWGRWGGVTKCQIIHLWCPWGLWSTELRLWGKL